MEIEIQPIEADLIGKTIYFDEAKFQSSLRFARANLLPPVTAIIAAYNALAVLPKFTQSVWEQIQTDSGADVQRQYMQFVEKDAAKFKTPSLREMARETAGEDLKPFFNAILKLQTSLQNPHNISDPLNYHFGMVRIDAEGNPVVYEDEIKEAFTVRIENEKQAEFYRAAQRFIAAGENIRQMLAGGKLDLSNQHWIDHNGTGGMFEVDRQGVLSLNPAALPFIK